MLEAARKQNAYPLGLVMLPQLVDSRLSARRSSRSQRLDWRLVSGRL